MDSFKFSQLQIQLATPEEKLPKPHVSTVRFGEVFSDHMFEVEWNSNRGWGTPRITPLHYFQMHPSSKILHYAQGGFEDMKAYKFSNNKVGIFRPHLHLERLHDTALRASLPPFDKDELLKCLQKLVSIDREWVPEEDLSSLYIRPTYIGIQDSIDIQPSTKALLYIITCPVGPYFGTGEIKPISLLADPQYVRAWPGGIGDKKMCANYASTHFVHKAAEKQGLDQVLWLFGEDHQITEVGAMNVFLFMRDCKGNLELVTPPLEGLILPGIVRKSVLDLARKCEEFSVSERSITMNEIIEANNDGRLLEMFVCGTAVSIAPVSLIRFNGEDIKLPTTDQKDSLYQRVHKIITDIQYGIVESEWLVLVD